MRDCVYCEDGPHDEKMPPLASPEECRCWWPWQNKPLPKRYEECRYCDHEFNSDCCCVNQHCQNCHAWGHYTNACKRKDA